MDREIRDEWVKRLRSGKYQQGIGFLHRKDNHGVDKFCCLGILCEIAADQDITNRINGEDMPGGDPGVHGYRDDGVPEYQNSTGVLPQSVVEWANLDNENPSVRNENGVMKHLSSMNDTHYPFTKIADLIEAGL